MDYQTAVNEMLAEMETSLADWQAQPDAEEYPIDDQLDKIEVLKESAPRFDNLLDLAAECLDCGLDTIVREDLYFFVRGYA